MNRNLKKILISTMPRSGTVFFSRFITELFEYKALEPKFTGGFRPATPYWDPYAVDETYRDMEEGHVLCAHYNLTNELSNILDREDTLGIYLYRDPRDVALSSALYIKHGLPHHFLHKTFKEMSDSDCITFMISGGVINADMFPDDMATSPSEYIYYEGMRYFIDNAYSWIEDSRILKVRYEDFFSNPLHIQGTLIDFGFDIGSIKIKETLAKWNFETASRGRTTGTEDKSSHFRKGIKGDYKNYFQPIHYALTRKLFGEDLIRLGYEKDYLWK